MKLGILTGHIRAKLEEFKALLTIPHTSQGARYEQFQEMQLSFGDLEIAIQTLEKDYDQNEEATPAHAKIITDRFEYRWNELIKSTNVYYLIDIKSPINTCFVLIAKYLAEQTNLVAPKNYLALLMPTVLCWENEKSHHDLSTQHRHTFIMNDENNWPIELGYLNERYDKKSKPNRLIMSHFVKGKEVELTKAEAQRIFEHSSLVNNYYKAFISDREDREDQVRVAKNRVIAALRDNDYLGEKIGSSYGTEGTLRLRENLLKRVNSIFKTHTQLIDYMAAKLDRKEWKGFIARLSDEALLGLFRLNGKEIGESLDIMINSKDTFIDSTFYNRAMLFCLVEAYWRDRKDKPEFTTNLGRLFGWSRTDKGNAKDAMQDELVDDAKCGVEREPAVNPEDRVSRAMMDGALGHIYLRMREILKTPSPRSEEAPDVRLTAVMK